jgi:hypothetical protein
VCRRSKVRLQAFYISLYVEKAADTQLVGGLVGPRAGQDVVAKREKDNCKFCSGGVKTKF